MCVCVYVFGAAYPSLFAGLTVCSRDITCNFWKMQKGTEDSDIFFFSQQPLRYYSNNNTELQYYGHFVE